MSNFDLVIVTNQKIEPNEVKDFLKSSFFLDIQNSETLSATALKFQIKNFEKDKIKHIKKVFFQKKVDYCFCESNPVNKKVFLSDMDATIIANETLDDLVKISGVKANIDETSKLAMEGKIDLRTTLSTRVNYLKGKPKSLINKVLEQVKFNPGSDVLVKTLNSKNYITSLITGGFRPISTFVGEKLGFQNIISNDFLFDDQEKFTGEYVPITGEKNSKYKYMEELSKKEKIEFSEFVSIGDGSNDLTMLKNSGLGIGYYAHKIVKDNIETQIQFTDLKTVLYFLGIKEEEFVS